MRAVAILLGLVVASCASTDPDVVAGIPQRPQVLPAVAPGQTDPTPQVIGGKGREYSMAMARGTATVSIASTIVRPSIARPPHPLH